MLPGICRYGELGRRAGAALLCGGRNSPGEAARDVPGVPERLSLLPVTGDVPTMRSPTAPVDLELPPPDPHLWIPFSSWGCRDACGLRAPTHRQGKDLSCWGQPSGGSRVTWGYERSWHGRVVMV